MLLSPHKRYCISILAGNDCALVCCVARDAEAIRHAGSGLACVPDRKTINSLANFRDSEYDAQKYESASDVAELAAPL